MVEHATENRSVGGSIPSLATIFLLCVGCAPDPCEGLCSTLRTELATCVDTWPVGWEEVDASSGANYQRQCENGWAAARAELEPRELQDALDQCEETDAALQSLADDGELCDSPRALYVD